MRIPDSPYRGLAGTDGSQPWPDHMKLRIILAQQAAEAEAEKSLVKMYPCKRCGEEFPDRAALMRHARFDHVRPERGNKDTTR